MLFVTVLIAARANLHSVGRDAEDRSVGQAGAIAGCFAGGISHDLLQI